VQGATTFFAPVVALVVVLAPRTHCQAGCYQLRRRGAEAIQGSRDHCPAKIDRLADWSRRLGWSRAFAILYGSAGRRLMTADRADFQLGRGGYVLTEWHDLLRWLSDCDKDVVIRVAYYRTRGDLGKHMTRLALV